MNWPVLALRLFRAVVIVPVVEELFWRAWLMRWLIDADFEKVPLGAYAPRAFWIVALLFASEHGPYWDVGLACGNHVQLVDGADEKPGRPDTGARGDESDL